MSYPVYYVPAGDVLPIMFDSFDGGTGASITMSGLAVTDVEIYKDGSVTQRASDAGYTLLDTDGIDFDGTTGIHGFSVDTGDDTDSGFYAVGAWYHVVVSSITVDAQTVNFIAAAFRIMPAEIAAGVPSVNATYVSGDSGAADNLETAFDNTAGSVRWLGIVDQGTMQAGSTGTTAVLRAALSLADDILNGSILRIVAGTGAGQARVIDDFVGATDTATVSPAWTTTPDNTSEYQVWGSPPGSTGAPLPANVTQWLGTAAATPTVAGVPEVDATHYLGSAAPALVGGRFDASVGAMAANVLTAAATAADFGTEIGAAVLTAAAADPIDANVEQINTVPIVGDGSGTPFTV